MSARSRSCSFLRSLALLTWYASVIVILKSESTVTNSLNVAGDLSMYSYCIRNSKPFLPDSLQAAYFTKSASLSRIGSIGKAHQINRHPTYAVPRTISSSIIYETVKSKGPSEVVQAFYGALSGNSSIDQSAIFEDKLNVMRGRDVAEAMFLSVKIWRRDRRVDIVRSHLKIISTRLAQFPSNCWRAKDVAFMLYSMQSVRSDDVGASEFLRIMSVIVEDSLQGQNTVGASSQTQRFSVREVSMVLYGLQGFRADSSELRHFLSVLKQRLLLATGTFDVLAVGQSLFGLQRMSSNYAEVRAILSALTTHIENCTGLFDPQAISNALYGMQEMSSDHVEVCALLSVLIPKILSCSRPLSAHELSSSIIGLKRMRSEHAEVRALLQALHPKALGCTEIPTAQGVSNMLYGLQGMSTEHKEVTLLLSALTLSMLRCSQDLSADALSRGLYGLQRADSAHAEVRDVIQLLALRIKSSRDVFTAENIGASLYGMQLMSADHVEVRSLLVALEAKIITCRAHPRSIDSKKRKFIKFNKKDLPHMRSTAVTNALYGLQRMSSEYVEVRSVITALIPLLKNCVDEFTPRALRNALCGLQEMKSDCREVCTLVATLVSRVSTLKGGMSSEELGSSLKGLRSLSCAHSEVRDMLSALVPKIEECEEVFTSRSISDAMSGLYYMSSDTAVMRDLLLVLVPKIQSCTEAFSAGDISRVLCSLRGMSSECMEVRTVLMVLVLKIRNCPQPFTASMVGAALSGLQAMSNEHIEVRTILFALIPKVKGCQNHFSAQDIGASLYGLQGLLGKVESSSLLDFLYQQVIKLGGCSEDRFRTVPTEDLISLSKYVALTLHSLFTRVRHQEQYPQWVCVGNSLKVELTRRKEGDDVFLSRGFEVTEMAAAVDPLVSHVDDNSGLIAVIRNAFKESAVRIFCNSLILNMFDSDVTLLVTVDDVYKSVDRSNNSITMTDDNNLVEDRTEYLTINIEIDKGKYGDEKSIRFTELRDRNLRSQGMFIVRASSTDLKNTGGLKLRGWVERMVSTYIGGYRERKEDIIYGDGLYDDTG